MDHRRLTGAGRKTHREIDKHLPSPQEKETLTNIVDNGELEMVSSGNAGFDQDGNWRIRIDSAGDLVIEVRQSGAWVEQAKYYA